MRGFGFTAVSIAAFFVAAPALAQDAASAPPLSLQVSGGGGGVMATQDGYELVSASDWLPSGHVGLALRGASGWEAGLEFRQGTTSNDVFGGDATGELRLRTAAVRGGWGYEGLPIVRPYVTAAVGLSHGWLAVTGGAARLEDGALGVDVHVAAGLEALAPTWIRVGGFADVGYAYRTPLDYDDVQDRDFGRSLDLGALDGSGLAWRLGARIVIPLARRPSPPPKDGEPVPPPASTAPAPADGAAAANEPVERAADEVPAGAPAPPADDAEDDGDSTEVIP